MAQNLPTAAQLVDAVRNFLADQVKPELGGHTAFNMMVALKSLEIVHRELEKGPGFAALEGARLADILGHGGPVAALNRELADHLRAGSLTLEDPSVRTHLIETTLAKVQIDQPSYSGLRQARARKGQRKKERGRERS